MVDFFAMFSKVKHDLRLINFTFVMEYDKYCIIKIFKNGTEILEVSSSTPEGCMKAAYYRLEKYLEDNK